MTHNVAEFLLSQQSLNRQWVSGWVPGGSAVKNLKKKQKTKQNKTRYMIDSIWFSRRVISGKKKKKKFLSTTSGEIKE